MTFLRVVTFSLVLMLAITWLTNILPQMQASGPDEEETVIASDINMAGMVALGEKLFSGKGTCSLCHNSLGRAPDLLAMDLHAAFSEVLENPGYEGEAKGKSGGEGFGAYIHESMVNPSAFVVAGFGKKGSNDTVSPMPVITGPPISLNETEMDAVTAFLQDLAGVEPTVALPSAEDTAAVSGNDAEEVVLAATAEEAIDKYACSACHDLNGSEADIGPNLNGIGKRMNREQLHLAILKPNDIIAEGYEADTMPEDFAEQMFVSELELIVDYLVGLKEKPGS